MREEARADGRSVLFVHRKHAESGVDADFYIFRDRSKDDVLPWDIIDGGMRKSFFQAEYQKSIREEWTLPPKRALGQLKFSKR